MIVEGMMKTSKVFAVLNINRYYIDRDPKHFRMLLAFLRNEKLNQEIITKEIQYELKQELAFYKIPFVSAVL